MQKVRTVLIQLMFRLQRFGLHRNYGSKKNPDLKAGLTAEFALDSADTEILNFPVESPFIHI